MTTHWPPLVKHLPVDRGTGSDILTISSASLDPPYDYYSDEYDELDDSWTSSMEALPVNDQVMKDFDSFTVSLPSRSRATSKQQPPSEILLEVQDFPAGSSNAPQEQSLGHSFPPSSRDPGPSSSNPLSPLSESEFITSY